jgi:hypothetical protein
VQSGEHEIQAPPGYYGAAEQLYVLFANAEAPGEGVDSEVIHERGLLPYAVDWSWLPAEDPRYLFDRYAPYTPTEVRWVTTFPVDGIGQGALGVRAEVVPPEGGPPQIVAVVVFGRGAIMGVVSAFQDAGGPETDVVQLARVMDDRLTRFQM